MLTISGRISPTVPTGAQIGNQIFKKSTPRANSAFSHGQTAVSDSLQPGHCDTFRTVVNICSAIDQTSNSSLENAVQQKMPVSDGLTPCRKAFGAEGMQYSKLDSLATAKIELFGKRCRKMISLFTAVQQFSSLAQVRYLFLQNLLITSLYQNSLLVSGGYAG